MTDQPDSGQMRAGRTSPAGENGRLLSHADELRRRGETQAAEELYHRMLSPSRGYAITTEDVIEINVGLGELLAHRGEIVEASSRLDLAYTSAIRLGRSDLAADAALKAAAVLIEAGRTNDAQQRIAVAVDQLDDPDDKRDLTAAARRLFSRLDGRYEDNRTAVQSAEHAAPLIESLSVPPSEPHAPAPVKNASQSVTPTIVQVEAAKLRLVTDKRLGKESPVWLKRVAKGLPAINIRTAG